MREIGGEKYEWLRLFDPCSVRISPTHKLVRCVGQQCINTPGVRLSCFKLTAFETAEQILEGVEEDDIKDGLTKYVTSLIGETVIDTEGKTKRVKKRSVPDDKGDIRRMAYKIAGGVNSFASSTQPLTSEALARCGFEQRNAICNVRIHLRNIELYPSEIEGEIKKMREAVWDALLTHTERFGLIARSAVIFGLGAEVPQGNNPIIKESPIRLVVIPAN